MIDYGLVLLFFSYYRPSDGL